MPSWARLCRSSLPAEVRRLLYTNDAIEALNSNSAARSGTRMISDDEAALKLSSGLKPVSEISGPCQPVVVYGRRQFAILFGRALHRAMVEQDATARPTHENSDTAREGR